MKAIRKVALVGVGLIGGSLVLDLRKNDPGMKVLGIDTSESNLERALERRVVDEVSSVMDGKIVDCDLVVIATPVAAMESVMKELAPLVSKDVLIIDVGSTKRLTLENFKRHLPNVYGRCVACHPIAGSDRSGALAAQFGLFDGKKVVLCPHADQDGEALDMAKDLWEKTGANVYVMDAATHDHILASVSHLPHFLSFAYMHQIAKAENKDELLFYAGSGFRDFTRIAASHPDVWTDIALANKESLVALLDEQEREIGMVRSLLEKGSRDGLKEYIKFCKDARDEWQKSQLK